MNREASQSRLSPVDFDPEGFDFQCAEPQTSGRQLPECISNQAFLSGSNQRKFDATACEGLLELFELSGGEEGIRNGGDDQRDQEGEALAADNHEGGGAAFLGARAGPSASGSMPTTKVSVVMRMGRSRSRLP